MANAATPQPPRPAARTQAIIPLHKLNRKCDRATAGMMPAVTGALARAGQLRRRRPRTVTLLLQPWQGPCYIALIVFLS